MKTMGAAVAIFVAACVVCGVPAAAAAPRIVKIRGGVGAIAVDGTTVAVGANADGEPGLAPRVVLVDVARPGVTTWRARVPHCGDLGDIAQFGVSPDAPGIVFDGHRATALLAGGGNGTYVELVSIDATRTRGLRCGEFGPTEAWPIGTHLDGIVQTTRGPVLTEWKDTTPDGPDGPGLPTVTGFRLLSVVGSGVAAGTWTPDRWLVPQDAAGSLLAVTASDGSYGVARLDGSTVWTHAGVTGALGGPDDVVRVDGAMLAHAQARQNAAPGIELVRLSDGAPLRTIPDARLACSCLAVHHGLLAYGARHAVVLVRPNGTTWRLPLPPQARVADVRIVAGHLVAAYNTPAGSGALGRLVIVPLAATRG